MKVQVGVNSSMRHEDGLLAVSLRLPEQELEYELDLPFRGLSERLGTPNVLALDLLLFASLCYLIDKTAARIGTPDGWTREFDVTFPVSDVAAWTRVASDLGQVLGFLSGDVWHVSFCSLGGEPFFCLPAPRRRHRRQPVRSVAVSKVCLFSGGLDSLIGAIDLVASAEREGALLIGHYDVAGPRSQQRDLYSNFPEHYRACTELLQVRISHRPRSAPERTQRSRSLVFLALGVYAANAIGESCPVYAPENGVIAVNIPVTPSRTGTCSTRTMHPFFLEQLRAVLRKLGFKNEIINPLRLRTKGECVAMCLDKATLESLIATSVSCSHATRRQNWKRRKATNCGYCVPCLFRRAALHKNGLDDGSRYGFDVCEGELPLQGGKSGDDLRAVLDCLARKQESDEIGREILGIAPVPDLSEHADLIRRGLEELRALIGDKAVDPIRRAAGMAGSRL